MNTQSHVILNLFLLKKYDLKKYSWPIIFGALIPDIPMFLFFLIVTFILRAPQREIWDVLYFQEGWQVFFNIFNSIPFFLIILGIAYYYKNTWVKVFSLSGILHCFMDLLTHREDAHAHFFPLTDWKFMSPISYWESSYYGVYFAIFEALLVLGASFYLWKIYRNKWARAAIVAVNVVTWTSFLVWFIVFRYF